MEPKSHLTPRDRLTHQAGKHAEIQQDLKWVNDITYVDSDKRTHTDLSVIECIETTSHGQTTFRWVTNLHITKKNAPI
jgi:hypothetical protein